MKAKSVRSLCVLIKGSLSVMKREVMAAARQGTVTWGVPAKIDNMRGVASGVLVMAVFNPAENW